MGYLRKVNVGVVELLELVDIKLLDGVEIYEMDVSVCQLWNDLLFEFIIFRAGRCIMN